MSKKPLFYDGKLISELGAKRYLKAVDSMATANINPLMRTSSAEKAWKECNFGCHGPTYRTLRKKATYSSFLQNIDNFSPFAAGLVDGARAKTIGQMENIARGVRRTADGLGINSKENYASVGDETWATYEFCSSTIEKVFNFEIDVPENPLAQSVLAVVSEYITALPEWVMESVVEDGAIKLPESVGASWLVAIVSLGIVAGVSSADLEHVNKLLNSDFTKNQIGKALGKKFSIAVAAVIAASITKQILRRSKPRSSVRRNLVTIKKAAQSMKGGYGTALISLLKVQGYFDMAGQASRRLQKSNPRLWHVLRFKLNGANMVYFMIEEMVQEYVDRLAILESKPLEFLKIMAALIKDKETNAIFFPYE